MGRWRSRELQRAKVLIVVTLIILFFALGTGFPVFHRMFYIFGALLVVGGLWSWLLARGIEVEVRRPALRTRAGQSVTEKVVVRRKNRLVRGFVEIREQTSMPVEAPGAVLGLDGAEPQPLDLEIPCPQRGVFQVGPVRVEASDPLGLYRLSQTTGQVQRLVVHPMTADLPGFVLLPADLPGEGPVHLRSQNITTSAYSVRNYVAGDSLNRIAWKATARHQRLMVKEFQMEPANNIWVLVDMERRANTGPAGRAIEETTITVAASIAKRYIDGGYPVGLLSYGNQRFIIPPDRGANHLLRIFDALAELRAHGKTGLLQLIADFQTRVGRYSSVALVTPANDDEWLDGVRHLILRRSRITVVVVDGDVGQRGHPEVAYRVAGLGVPTYTVKAGANLSRGLVSLTVPGQAYSPVLQRVLAAQA